MSDMDVSHSYSLPTPSYRMRSQEIGSPASQGADISTNVQSNARHRKTGLLSKFLKRFNTEKHNAITLPFLGFAWDVYGDDLLDGNVATLSQAQLDVVNDIAALIAADGRPFPFAADQQMQARIYALGLIAQEMNDRPADRFSRRALRDAPTWMLSLVQTS